jgi:hypothetical protein
MSLPGEGWAIKRGNHLPDHAPKHGQRRYRGSCEGKGYDESVDSEKDIFTAAMALPVEKRARLARELLASLDESEDAGVADAWLEEIDRRACEVEDGTARLEEWSAVRERLERRWASK